MTAIASCISHIYNRHGFYKFIPNYLIFHVFTYPMELFFNFFFIAVFAFFVPFTVMTAFLLMPLNAFLLMVLSFPAVTVIFFIFLQPANALLPIVFTFAGITIDDSFVHL